MKRGVRRRNAVLLGALTAVGSAALVTWVTGVKSDIAVFRTPDRVGTGVRPADLYVRTVSNVPDTILVTRNIGNVEDPGIPVHWPVYKYIAGDHRLVELPKAHWIEYQGPVASPKPVYGDRGDTRCRMIQGELHCGIAGQGYHKCETLGQNPLEVLRGPSQAFVAVLSADGWERPEIPIIPFLASIGGGYTGQHYIELFKIPSMERFGKPIRIPFTTARDFGQYVWSADGRFLVLSNKDGTKMCVLHVDIDPKPKRKREPNRKEGDE